MTTINFPEVHNWTVKVAGCRFGIVETGYGDFGARYPDYFKPTTVYLGRTSFDTHCTAYECLGITAFSGVVLLAAVAFVIARVSRRQDAV